MLPLKLSPLFVSSSLNSALCHAHTRVWYLLLGLAGTIPSVAEGSLENLGEPYTLSPLRERENETSPPLPQATRKQFARQNSTSNANKIIMTIFMGE